MKTIKYRRTSEIKITKEALLLREIRVKQGLSIREVGRRLGRSESYIRHIEKGRLDPPMGVALKEILEIYDVTLRQFNARLKKGEIERHPKSELISIINYLDEANLCTLLKIAKSLSNVKEDV